MEQEVTVMFWATRSYDVRIVASVDKKDYDAALDYVGEGNPEQMFIYLDNIGYEFETDDMSMEDEIISDMDVLDD